MAVQEQTPDYRLQEPTLVDTKNFLNPILYYCFQVSRSTVRSLHRTASLGDSLAVVSAN